MKPVVEEWDEQGGLCLLAGRRRRPVGMQGDRDDQLRLVHGLARLVHKDLELRLCRDSVGNSSNAFLALPPAVWRALAAEFPVHRCRERFLRLPADFERFLDCAFPLPAFDPKQKPGYWENWVDCPDEWPADLRYEIVDDGDGRLRSQVLLALIQRYLDPGPQWLDLDQQSQQPPVRLRVDREALLDQIRDRVGKLSIRVASESRAGFLLIERNGVATGWRADAPGPHGAA